MEGESLNQGGFDHRHQTATTWRGRGYTSADNRSVASLGHFKEAERPEVLKKEVEYLKGLR
jgi:hypothetical protein